jgi:hypothetical protein
MSSLTRALKHLMTTFIVLMVGCEGGGRQDAVPAVSEEPPRLGAGDLTHRVLIPGLPGLRLAQALPRQVNQNRYKCAIRAFHSFATITGISLYSLKGTVWRKK